MDPVEYDIRTSGYAAAFSSIRAAKNILWLILGLCLLLQIAGFVLVEFVHVLDGPAQAEAPVLSPPPRNQPTTATTAAADPGETPTLMPPSAARTWSTDSGWHR